MLDSFSIVCAEKFSELIDPLGPVPFFSNCYFQIRLNIFHLRGNGGQCLCTNTHLQENVIQYFSIVSICNGMLAGASVRVSICKGMLASISVQISFCMGMLVSASVKYPFASKCWPVLLYKYPFARECWPAFQYTIHLQGNAGQCFCSSIHLQGNVGQCFSSSIHLQGNVGQCFSSMSIFKEMLASVSVHYPVTRECYLFIQYNIQLYVNVGH